MEEMESSVEMMFFKKLVGHLLNTVFWAPASFRQLLAVGHIDEPESFPVLLC